MWYTVPYTDEVRACIPRYCNKLVLQRALEVEEGYPLIDPTGEKVKGRLNNKAEINKEDQSTYRTDAAGRFAGGWSCGIPIVYESSLRQDKFPIMR
jgi:hypothetical protein